jgi:cell division protein FtsQ
MRGVKTSQTVQVKRLRGFRASLLALVFSVSLLGAHWAWSQLQRPDLMPLARVMVDGPGTELRRDQLEAVVTLSISGNFFTLDINAIRQAALSLNWVNAVSVSRHWPDTLDIHVKERQPFVRWGEGHWVDAEGVIFDAANQQKHEHLPLLMGPEAEAAEVVERYRSLAARFQQTYGGVSELRLDAAGWTFQLAEGPAIALGSQDLQARLQRAMRVMATTSDSGHRLQRLDARYSNGVAVVWHASDQTDGLGPTAWPGRSGGES